MIKLDTQTPVEMHQHIWAGRQAALNALVETASQLSDGTWNNTTYAGATIRINNFDITPAIDAVVMETIVRMQPEPKRRRWWVLWR